MKPKKPTNNQCGLRVLVHAQSGLRRLRGEKISAKRERRSDIGKGSAVV
jgi:hypothetical protein